MTKDKKFNSVDMKHEAQEKLDEETKGMTHEERKRYLQKKRESGPLAEKWNRLKARQNKDKKAS